MVIQKPGTGTKTRSTVWYGDPSPTGSCGCRVVSRYVDPSPTGSCGLQRIGLAGLDRIDSIERAEISAPQFFLGAARLAIAEVPHPNIARLAAGRRHHRISGSG
jgi:hypothetical protein